mgnify:CR=1 FL=1
MSEADIPQAPSPVSWYHSPVSLIVSFLTVGPFMLPLVWTHPKLSPNAKRGWSAAILIATGALAAGVYKALAKIFQYYDLMLGL